MRGWGDEKEIVILSLIASTLILVTLEPMLGTIYSFFLTSYALFMKSPYSIQFSKTRKYVSPEIIFVVFLSIGVWYLISSAFFTVSPFAMYTFSTIDFNIQNPIIKLIVWGVFIPLAETLFFLGLLFPFLKKKMDVRKLDSIMGITLLGILGVVVALFHISAQVISQEMVVIDTLFFGVSAATVLAYDELKYAFYLHAFINFMSMMLRLGMI